MPLTVNYALTEVARPIELEVTALPRATQELRMSRASSTRLAVVRAARAATAVASSLVLASDSALQVERAEAGLTVAVKT